jgi:hypothetical protein
MRPTLFIFTVFLGVFFAFTTVSFAQTSANDDGTVTAELRAGLTVANVSDLDFGLVQQAADGSASSVVTPEFGAQFNVTGNNDADVSVTLSTATLVLTGGTGVSVATWVMHATDTQTYSAGPNILTTTTTGGTVLSTLGAKTLWLGGTLTGAAASDPGSYTGTINVDVAYN